MQDEAPPTSGLLDSESEISWYFESNMRKKRRKLTGEDGSYIKAYLLAERWDYHPETVAAWCRQGQIKGAIKPRGRWLIPIKWVKEAGGLE